MEMNKIIAVLKEIRTLAGESSMTGMFRKSTILVTHYNACLEKAKEQGLLGDYSLFNPLPEDAKIDDVGISAALLARCIQGDKEASEHRDFIRMRHEDE